jgi:hypothetical protein
MSVTRIPVALYSQKRTAKIRDCVGDAGSREYGQEKEKEEEGKRKEEKKEEENKGGG